MGKKTDKKIKSDRINVLRKQYDSFIEEDKKRKDRNDYILGRLDKMRNSCTAVQLKAPNAYRDQYPPSYNRYAFRPEYFEGNDMQMVQMSRPVYDSRTVDVPRNYIEETSILNEISKKYILIPKLRPSLASHSNEIGIPPVTSRTVAAEKPNIDNNDWKSKYSILEELKKNENEEIIKEYVQNDKKDIDNCKNYKNNDLMMQNYLKEELPTRYEEEVPEKDVSDQLVVESELKALEKLEISDNLVPNNDAIHAPNALFLNAENAESYNNPTQNEIFDERLSEAIVEHSAQAKQCDIPVDVEAFSNITENVEYQENYPEEITSQQEYPIEYEQFMPSAETDANNSELGKDNYLENDYRPIEVINPNELVNEIKNDNTLVEAQNEGRSEILNTQEYSSEEAVLAQQHVNQENHVIYDETVVQGNLEQQLSAENPPDNSGIEEFDAEQREMFYAEQADDKYPYDQQGGGDAYNAEYTEKQNYPQSQEYPYYEGAEQEQATFPVEINEHEETQQLYDQNYEQQYTTVGYEQGYEPQNVYMEQDPAQLQFEEPALYDKAQQEYDNYSNGQQPAETQEEVQQVLDQEDGYTENHTDPASTQENKQSA